MGRSDIIAKNTDAKKEWYNCPICGKHLLRITKESEAKDIYLYCKYCRKEIKINIRAGA